MEVEKDLVLAIPSTKRIKHRTPGMTVMGLQKLLHMLNKRVTGDMYTSVEATLARYMSRDTSMVIELDLKKTSRKSTRTRMVKHQYQDLYAAMVMGKTLEEDFQKEHKNSNGCTSSRSVCRPADPPWWQQQSTNIKICMPSC